MMFWAVVELVTRTIGRFGWPLGLVGLVWYGISEDSFSVLIKPGLYFLGIIFVAAILEGIAKGRIIRIADREE